jgi:predicted Rossmann-fold nucleotide-binding protein
VKAYSKPIVIVNLDGFYDGLLQFSKHVFDEGFLIDRHFEHLKIVKTVAEAIDWIKKQA